MVKAHRPVAEWSSLLTLCARLAIIRGNFHVVEGDRGLDAQGRGALTSKQQQTPSGGVPSDQQRKEGNEKIFDK